MDRQKGLIKRKRRLVVALLTFLFSQSIFALSPNLPVELPGSVQPGRISNQILPKQNGQPSAGSPIQAPTEQATSPLGEQAKKITFVLTKVILEGNHVYSEAQLRPLYADKLHKKISVAELQDIVQTLSNYYRNNGYIITRAILPPQHVANGVVRIRILEGYIDRVEVIGHPKGARSVIQAYGNNISHSKPLQIKDMERNLLIANEIPGVQVKAVLSPSETQQAASNLNLNAETKTFGEYFSYDDYGTRYSGPQQMTAGVQGNSLFKPGDATHFTYATTPKGNELQYKDIAYDAPFGSNGLRLGLDANRSATNPLFVLQPTQIAGLATTYSGNFTYPVIRSRSENFTMQGGWNYQDSNVTILDQPLYTDHIRSIQLGGLYDFADRFAGSNILGLTAEQGINVLGASNNPTSTMTSRYGATGVFTKFNAQVARNQFLGGRFSVYGIVKGQYSFNPLLSAEQFGFGGAQMGRGYDPAEILGDRGAGGTLELRMDVAPGNIVVQTAQFYVFYDAGLTWNLRNIVQGVSTKQSATSTGVGVRFYIMKYLSGNFAFTQPLTRQVQSLELIGNGKCPRVLFSITAAN